jgi:hypothetical protein
MDQRAGLMYPATGWWRKRVFREADRERVGMGERIGGAIGAFFIVLVFVLLIDIQNQDVGFFTAEFGPLEQALFYGSLLYGLFPNLLRLITGSRNLSRLADAVGSIIFVIAGSYLLIVFPFDFPALVQYLFGSASSAFSWITNDLVQVVWMIGIVISALSAAYNIPLFVSVHRELRSRRYAAANTTTVPPGQG